MKSWKQSVTVWVNGLSVVFVALLATLEATLPVVAMYLPPHVYAYLMIALAVINTLLRLYKTYQPLDTNTKRGQ